MPIPRLRHYEFEEINCTDMSQKELDYLLSDEGLAKLKEEAKKSSPSPEWEAKYGERAWETALIVFGINSPQDGETKETTSTMSNESEKAKPKE